MKLNFEKKFDECINEITKDNLNEIELHNLLYNLGMVSNPPKNNEEKEAGDNEENNMEVVVESPLQQEEKRLINEIMNSLKNDQNEVNKEDIKDFLICVLGVQKYDFYRRYKPQFESELKQTNPQKKIVKEELPELIIKKQNGEILSKVDKNNMHIKPMMEKFIFL